MSAPS